MARDILNRSNESVGIDQRMWVLEETGYGNLASAGLFPIATDGIEHVTAMLDFKIPREDAAHRSGRSLVTRLSKKKEVKWSFESYIVPTDPTGSNPNLPDMHPMLINVFGSCDQTDATKKIYKLTRASARSFRMLEEGTHFSRLAVGCVADSVTFTLPGDGMAMVKYEGFAQDLYTAGHTTLAQAITGSAVAATLVKQDLTYTSAALSADGNLVSIDYTTGAVAGAEVVTVTGNAISIQISTGVSTATQVKTAFDAAAAATALASVAISGTGSNTQSATGAAQFLTGGLSISQLKVASGEAKRIEAGSYLDVISASDGNTQSNSAKLVTAIGTGVNADIVTVSTSLAAASASDIVIGAAPDFTASKSENALLGLKGSFTTGSLGTIDCQLLSAEIGIKNNFTPKNMIYGTDSNCGYIADKRREVTLKLDVLLTQDNYEFYVQNKTFVADSVTIVLAPQDIPAPINAAAGRSFTFRFTKVEFDVPTLEQPGDSYVKLTLEGKALAADINTVNNEFELEIS